MNNIYLIGFMGTGKSTVAKELQKFLPFQIVEMDEAIERLEAMTISEIFKKKGEEGFRNVESQLLSVIAKERNQIVSCGGGIILKPENISIMKESGTVVRLTASVQEILNRVSSSNERPLVNGKTISDIQKMIDDREQYYADAADIVVDSGVNTPDAVASEIVRQLALNGCLN